MKKKQRDQNLAAMQQLAGLMFRKVDPGLIGLGAEHLKEFLHGIGSSTPTEEAVEARAKTRWQDKLIEQEIAVGASVLDLGCGKGELLSRLMDMRRVYGQGIEIDAECVMSCVEQGIPVFQTDLETGLKGFPDGSFDFVILEETIQTLQKPADTLIDMLRVGKRAIITFPNFGYWRVRMDLAIRGRMPVTEWLPYRWHNTPNIHLLTLQDFLDWTTDAQIQVVESYAQVEGQVRQLRPEDNLYAEEVLFVLEKEGDSHGSNL